ncbi:hypothetical protein RJ640_009051 [Escallonia rubra]|uniref:Uncharacterized protein n=1 Tax=Escallonia rubra TaxID=112253 RepID=A0AA88UMK1_9ASTE|nr:hypothetical protein RJ640_009051 [Escallonia rubra]
MMQECSEPQRHEIVTLTDKSDKILSVETFCCKLLLLNVHGVGETRQTGSIRSQRNSPVPASRGFGPAVFSVEAPSIRIEASQPWTKQSWKCILSKPGATLRSDWKWDLTVDWTIDSARAHQQFVRLKTV